MRIDPPVLAHALQHPLLPYIILLSPNEVSGFSREWSPPQLFAERSLGYAFQWLAFAIVLIIIYIVMWRKNNHAQK